MDLATIVLSTLLLGATVADTESTMLAQSRGYSETNPILRPISGSRAGLYAVKLSVSAALMIWTHQLRHSEHRLLRIIGWALPLELVILQSLAAAHNGRL
jgi:hypothetical protein